MGNVWQHGRSVSMLVNKKQKKENKVSVVHVVRAACEEEADVLRLLWVQSLLILPEGCISQVR